MRRDPIDEIISYNSRFVGRYPHDLRQKVDRMASGSFGFFRGTFHLFARDIIDGVLDPWQNGNPFTQVETALVGDIHSENYGTFRDEQGATRLDIDDFDETTHGSFDFDCKRAATSLFLAMSDVGVGWAAAVVHVATFMRTYATMIERFAKHGGAELFGYSDSNPPKEKALRQLIDDAAGASRTKAIGKATTWDDKKKARTLVRTDKLYDLKPADRAQAERLVADYVSRSPQHPGNGKHFFDIEDICGRTAGCGSLGRLRYAVLVSGEDSEAAKNQLLEFKESLPSAYDEYRQREQDALARRGRAEEVVGVERAMQTSSSPFIGFCIDGDMSFQVKPMGVRAQRLPWDTMKKDSDFDSVAQVYGELLAKCHAKADGQPGHPGRARIEIADALAGKEEVFVKRVTAFALAYCELVEDDHRRFAAATDKVKQALQL